MHFVSFCLVTEHRVSKLKHAINIRLLIDENQDPQLKNSAGPTLTVQPYSDTSHHRYGHQLFKLSYFC